MTNPLPSFLLTLVVGWLSVGVVGVKYAATVQEAARQTAQGDPPPPPPPQPPVEPKKGGPNGTNPPVEPPVNPRPPDPDPGPSPPNNPPPAVTQLPANVNWAAGDVLVLVAAADMRSAVLRQLGQEVSSIKEQLAERLVGGEVFVADGSRVWKWNDWTPREVNLVSNVPPRETFIKTFAAVKTDLEAIRRRLNRPTQTLVLWHSAYCPVDLPAGAGFIDQAAVLWSGKELEEQRRKSALTELFGERGVIPHGPEIGGLANAVVNCVGKNR